MKTKFALLNVILLMCHIEIMAITSHTVKVTQLEIQDATKQAICEAIYGTQSQRCPGTSSGKKPYRNIFGFIQEQIIEESTTDLDTTWASQEALTSSNLMNPSVPNNPAITSAPSVLQADLDAMWTGSGSVIQSTPSPDDLFSATLQNYYQAFYPVFMLKAGFFVPKQHSTGSHGLDSNLANVYSRLLALQYQIPNCISYIPSDKSAGASSSTQDASNSAKSNKFEFKVSSGSSQKKHSVVCKTTIDTSPNTACPNDSPSPSNINYTVNGYYCLARSILKANEDLKNLTSTVQNQIPSISNFSNHVNNINSDDNTHLKIMDNKSQEDLDSFKDEVNNLVSEMRPVVLKLMASNYRQSRPTARVPDMMSLLGKDNYDKTLPSSYAESQKLSQCVSNLELTGKVGLTQERQRSYLQNLTNFAKTPDLLLPGYVFAYAKTPQEENMGLVKQGDTPVLAAGQLYNFKESSGVFESKISNNASIKPAKNSIIPKINSFRAQIKTVLSKDITQFKADSNYFIAQKGFVMGNLYGLASPRSALYSYSCQSSAGGKISLQLTPAQAETYNATFRLRGSSTETSCADSKEKSWRCRVVNESDSTSLLKEMLMTMAENREAQFKQYLLNEKAIASMALLHMQKLSSSQNTLLKSKRKKIKELTEEYVKGKASGGGDGAQSGAEEASNHIPPSATKTPEVNK
ncbi:MAG TPA: hypothetical protein QF353_03500 [Gammaproteobacteria bacterium]|nr:hypothetical protein [Gammaproteobacteria bacterium]